MKPALALGILLVAAPVVGAQESPSGEQIVQQGNGQGATACIACHGPQGAGNAAAGYPRLSMLNADYLSAQLRAYQQGTRTNPIMQPIAKALSDAEIEAVAEYYAGKTSEVPAPETVDTELLHQGEELALQGAWKQTIPACVSCHGPGGNGVGTHFPALAGQHAAYIEGQIQAWKNGQRSNDPNQLMEVVAQRLSEAQIKAVAAYFASLKPGQ